MRKTNQNRNESSFRSTRRGRHAAAAELRRAICEVIEPRIMLSATLGSHITASITPSSIPESLFLPGSSTSDVYTSSTINQITSDSYRFSLNTTSAVTFNTGQVGSSGFASDVALGLYDSSGNLLQSQFTAGTGTSAVQTISATLSAGQVYELVAYIEKTSGTSLHTIALTANTGSQAIADTIAINPATNSGLLTASAAPDAFTSSTSVRYFPVNLLNADYDASVAISAAGPDTSVYAALYQQNIGGGSYVQLASGTGLPTLSLASYEFQTVGSSATDYNCLLAVSPLNFSASAEAFKVTVSTDTPLLPATVSATPNSGSFTPVLSSPGTVSGTYNTGSTSTDSTVAVTAVVTGPMTVTASGVSVPVLGVYAPGGTSLLAVGTGAISASVTFNASAGQTYIMSTNPYNGGAVGNYTIQASQTNVPTTALSAGARLLPRTGYRCCRQPADTRSSP